MTYVGQAVPSLTNTKLVAGRGRFVDDIQLPGMTYAAILRSPFAHARIRSIDSSKAEALPGVLHVITGREVANGFFGLGLRFCPASPPQRVERRLVHVTLVAGATTGSANDGPALRVNLGTPKRGLSSPIRAEWGRRYC